MKKEEIFLKNFASSSDYKLEQLEWGTQRNFESIDKWLYLGVDNLDVNFAKIGITMGDLASRSYSSSRPSYYLFCAFKCKYNISQQDLKRIEEDVLSRIDYLYRNSNGSTKRMIHFESGALSECFYPVNFLDFYKDVHREIYEHHRSSFVICGLENEIGGDDGEFVDCIFNPKIRMHQNSYIRMILQYD